MQKARLRKEMLQKRLGYEAADISRKSRQIAANFFGHFSLEDIKAVHVFLPIRLKNEIDTWPIIRKLQAEYPHIQVIASVSDLQEFTLTHHWLLPETELVENKWGIPEPRGAEAIPVEKIDMVLVPLLAFDQQGHRVGYGKGFYDRFLELCRPDTLKVGLSLEEPITAITDIHPGDTALDFALTPTHIYKFGN
ncbi:5-formyltetrahydrofolate cyclo-ligase [Adhaeribacter aerolatus]|uniref:5-formyltetrahydrofolate cyclo-ligase n=1 Tax=Adhaeribacter aerolatus TaxID=670289 RepID=A0A512B177_9BACT|nr:5-formyltetrahydrofolate cyclo-ligase [Adhaeribacter aerolatus]GEO05710.1 5-formyltetrahydrofolate cyclo-ligase [Adhaeribacter aerolatus]